MTFWMPIEAMCNLGTERRGERQVAVLPLVEGRIDDQADRAGIGRGSIPAARDAVTILVRGYPNSASSRVHVMLTSSVNEIPPPALHRWSKMIEHMTDAGGAARKGECS